MINKLYRKEIYKDLFYLLNLSKEKYENKAEKYKWYLSKIIDF